MTNNYLFQQGDPDSEHYVFPSAKTTKEIVRLLYSRQVKVFGETISQTQPELTEKVLMRNIKLLLDKYDLELVLRGIERAVLMADHPFSTAFVEQQIEYYLWLKE